MIKINSPSVTVNFFSSPLSEVKEFFFKRFPDANLDEYLEKELEDGTPYMGGLKNDIQMIALFLKYHYESANLKANAVSDAKKLCQEIIDT
ncbi:MAG TPA: hypothetical protein PLZ43_13960, partial [bacterium]|nr:hypothetical protein [bacterium]